MHLMLLQWKSTVSRCLAVGIVITTPVLQAADLPVKQIILYKHGIAYFERQGTLAAGEEARLDFKNADMNDILKSLVVTDHSGHRVAAIHYDSNETLGQRLDRSPSKSAAQNFSARFSINKRVLTLS